MSRLLCGTRNPTADDHASHRFARQRLSEHTEEREAPVHMQQTHAISTTLDMHDMHDRYVDCLLHSSV